MRASRAFVLGAVMGAAVVWLWGRPIQEYVEAKTRRVRTKAADGGRAVAETAGKVLARGGEILHRVDASLQDLREDVGEALRAGQEAIRSARTPGSPDSRGRDHHGQEVGRAGTTAVVGGHRPASSVRGIERPDAQAAAARERH